jgi:hypothetical protein
MVISVDTKSTLRRYAGRTLTVICRYCEFRGTMPVAELAARIGWDTEIERHRRLRLKCSKCGEKEPALSVSDLRPT